MKKEKPMITTRLTLALRSLSSGKLPYVAKSVLSTMTEVLKKLELIADPKTGIIVYLLI